MPCFCPPTFYTNCKNAPFKCTQCRGYSGLSVDPLFYKPISRSSTPHPAKSLTCSDKKPFNKTKSKQVKNGFKQEDILLKKSVRSGAKFNDGDLYAESQELRIDSKVRHTNSKTFTLRANEYLKGKQQGIEAWVLTHKDEAGVDTSMVVMTYELFLELLKLSKKM